jgi:hypothetical protein
VLAQTIAKQAPRALARGLGDSIFRANPDYELLLLDQLPAEEQKLLCPLRGDANFFGLIRHSTATGLTTKGVSGEAAELFKLLQKPGRLPVALLGESESELIVSRLVYDGILQVAQGSEWICGPAACEVETLPLPEDSGRILAGLSLQAIRHAASLASADSKDLSSRLYLYNTLPLTPQWLRRIPGGTALEEYLQIQLGGGCRSELDRDWARASPEAEQGVWLAWSSRSSPWQRTGVVGYKLYLSALPLHLRVAFRAWLPAITAAGAYHFKIGSNARGLLRPDKIVAYFSDRAALEEAAYYITKELSGCPSQGVPFTAELNAGALLSWASDPPMEENVPTWLRRQSWRQWICFRLGSALAIAKREQSAAIPAWRFALERLRLEGVDVTTWAPGSELWQSKSDAGVASP